MWHQRVGTVFSKIVKPDCFAQQEMPVVLARWARWAAFFFFARLANLCSMSRF